MAGQSLPESFQVVAVELQPYIHNRYHVKQTRNLIASHLAANTNSEDSLLRPLSLIHTHHARISSYESHSLYEDYLKAFNANLAARDAYSSVVSSNSTIDNDEPKHVDQATFKANFVRLTRSQQKHERLDIIHEHIDKLTEQHTLSEQARPLSTTPTLDALPPIPPTLLSINDQGAANNGNLRQLTLDLERAVLKAKLLLKREQKLLAKVRSEQSHPNSRSVSKGAKIQALGSTRNELIIWMESELSKEGVEEGGVSVHQTLIGDIPSKLEGSTALYAEYISLRSGLLDSMAENHSIGLISRREADSTKKGLPETSIHGQYPTASLLTCLDQVVSLSNEQKAITQQKSHMALSLSKHNKTLGQMLDRQAEESHILSSHQPSNTHLNKLLRGTSSSFAEDMSASERSDFSQQAQVWAASSGAANKSMKDAVSSHLEEGGEALLIAQETLLGLLELLGNDLEAGEESSKDGPDIWNGIDGKLGVI